MKKLFLLIIGLFFFGNIYIQAVPVIPRVQYPYTESANDPLNVRLYKLPNGLKVYMCVNKDVPRIQTYIAVRAGSKNDPTETTGLAHYLEHMMFKGSYKVGTTNWPKEAPLLAEIKNVYEQYRKITDTAQRRLIYKQIDSLSFEASQYAIPNEYDKLMSAIGSQGTNAFTSYDYTAYQENIPSNQLENWAKIEGDRFANMVPRLFHTEIEAVYEEKNMSLTNDQRTSQEALYRALLKNHPYGTHSVIGTAEHLKNPSIKNIEEFYKTYYVANNMAVILCGDFNPDEAIEIIVKYFKLRRNSQLEPPVFQPEDTMAAPIVKNITGLDAEHVRIGFLIGKAGSKDELLADMLGYMLYNGKAGLIDLNLNQKQKVLSASAGAYCMVDHGFFTFYGKPKANQSLEEVKDLMLEQLELIKKGEFPDWLIEATINNLKYAYAKQFESNEGRASLILTSYTDGKNWKDVINYTENISKITKQDLIDYANKTFQNNYAVVYKNQGKPENIVKIEKPAITPIHVNKDEESAFLQDIKLAKVKKIEPVFLDFSKDMQTESLNKKVPLLYKQNTENATFELYYYFNMGSEQNKTLPIAIKYLNYLGTKKYSPEQIKEEFYKLACSFDVNASNDETMISISGLSENMIAALSLFEELLKDCEPNPQALENLINDELKKRKDQKANQYANFHALVTYVTYGPKIPFAYKLTEEELKKLTPADLLQIIQSLPTFKHQVLYYGPLSLADAKKAVNKYHKVSKQNDIPQGVNLPILNIDRNRLFFSHYDANQSCCQLISNGMMHYDRTKTPIIDMYNNYFGGGMNTVVFQELREKRSLAYSAGSNYRTPSKPEDAYINSGFIITQNDKVVDALETFNDLYNNMPLSEPSFELAKEALLNNIETERIIKMNVIWAYLRAQKFHLDGDIRKEMYDKIQTMSLDDLKAFNDQYIKNRPKSFIILGDENDFNFNVLEEKFGTVKKLSQEEIFGY